jgi:hypothetical protein
MRSEQRAQFPFGVQRPNVREYVAWLEAARRKTPAVQEALERARQVIAQHSFVAYIAGPLTGVDEEYKERYVRAAEICEAHNIFGYAPHIHGTDPVQHPDVSPEEVRDIDFLWAVVMPHFHLNFLYPMGHGNAIEAGWAETYQIPAIFCVPDIQKLSRLVRGLLNIQLWVRYKDHADLYGKLDAVIKQARVLII